MRNNFIGFGAFLALGVLFELNPFQLDQASRDRRKNFFHGQQKYPVYLINLADHYLVPV